jgi:hypothetical protein
MDLLQQIEQIRFPAPLPQTLLAVEQSFDTPRVKDLHAEVGKALHTSGILAMMKPGDTVAIGAGSRGIANLAKIVRAAVDHLKAAGMKPYVVPAMGSHGGATAEGQIEILAGMGVTEEAIGTEIRATMEVEAIGQIENGPILYQGKDSLAADHTILVSRIKPHTDFRSHLESGPSKMSVIGLGKQHGASIMHAGGGRNFQRYLEPAARIYETNTNLRGAICPVENAFEDTALIAGLTSAEIGTEKEVMLLKRAKDYIAQIPFEAVDILVVQQLGKNISGTGMDTNVISRLMIPRQPEAFGKVDMGIIVVLDLTEPTHGNVSGLGIANITTARVFSKIDWVATYTNALTSGIFGMYRVHLPITMPDDERALHAAVLGCAEPPAEAKMVFIRDTLSLEHFFVSPSMREIVEAHPRLRIVDEVPLRFDEDGTMMSPWQMEPAKELA